MQDFLQFVTQNWWLWALFFLVLAIIAWFETRTTVGGITKIDPHGLVRLINHENAAVIDVRETNAFKDGHIVGAISIPFAQLAENNKKISRLKDKPIVLVCVVGQTSMRAAHALKKQEFTNLYSLQGGMNAWKGANLPVEKS